MRRCYVDFFGYCKYTGDKFRKPQVITSLNGFTRYEAGNECQRNPETCELFMGQKEVAQVNP